MRPTIYITQEDLQQIQSLLHQDGILNLVSHRELSMLKHELLRARIVPSEEIPRNLVTMNSKVQLRRLDTGQTQTITVVFPAQANHEEGRISVLAPLGMAVLGYCVGDVFEWEMPTGVRRYRVQRILYQPEAAAKAVR